MPSNPMNDQSVSAKARAKRAKLCAQCLITHGMERISVLDIGGTKKYWEMNLKYFPTGMIKEVDIVNLPPVENKCEILSDTQLHIYSGNALEKDTLRMDHYDLIHSNSVIEHVGNLRMQQKMAQIISSIGPYHWIQTPARTFPLEPHFYFPFFAYLPLGFRTFLHTKFKLGFMGKQPDWIKARIACEETRLLTKSELQALFPTSKIFNEKLFFLTKSYIVTNM